MQGEEYRGEEVYFEVSLMNTDIVYSFLIVATGLFMGVWATTLVLACVAEFRHDRS